LAAGVLSRWLATVREAAREWTIPRCFSSGDDFGMRGGDSGPEVSRVIVGNHLIRLKKRSEWPM
jgi:hypothetical protein